MRPMGFFGGGVGQSWRSFVTRNECVTSADGQKDCFPLKGQCQIFLHNFFFASVCPNEAIIILIVTAIAQAVSDRKALFTLIALTNNLTSKYVERKKWNYASSIVTTLILIRELIDCFVLFYFFCHY